MSMLNTREVLETINMIKDENLDIRTITMGISLYDCSGDERRPDVIYKALKNYYELLKAGDISAGHGRALLGLKDKEIIVDTAHKILIRSLSVRDTEALVKKLNKIYEASLNGEDENEVDDDLIVDYIKDLERKAMTLTGKQIKIQNKGKCRLVQIEYVDNEDLEDILVKLCGKKITEE